MGHTLDIVISESGSINNLLVYNLGVPDYIVISFEVSCLSSKILNVKSISIILKTSIKHQVLSTYILWILRAIQQSAFWIIPLKSSLVSFSHSAPWYTCELCKIKTVGLRSCAFGLLASQFISWLDHQNSYAKSFLDAQSALEMLNSPCNLWCPTRVCGWAASFNFILYLPSLGCEISRHGISLHCYADDAQLYLGTYSKPLLLQLCLHLLPSPPAWGNKNE
ncbi:hypothetical protein ILYODFUR_034553 [Ilyodon furcidens]|uniref:Reverse transcriptase domain-containing protein n=1 Tax=Ilyodon furcidens TaxID=33524 RepID=A0ABV0STR1_9TELE